jgi:hypothetical protein
LPAGCAGTTAGAPTAPWQPAADQPPRTGPWLLP